MMTWREILALHPQITEAPCDISPLEAGYEEERLAVLNCHIQSLIEEGRILSGSYCLWRHGNVFADVAIGNLACPWQGNQKFLPETMFEIQSVGKIFTAAAVLKLAEDGILYLDQPVFEWIEEFSQGDFREITILHLLTHTSGLCALDGVYPPDERKWWTFVDENRPEQTWISAVVRTGLHAKPGEKWLYSLVGYTVLGEIIRRAAGMEAEEYIRKTIFVPCDMTEIHWRKEGTKELVRRYNIANETDLRMAGECEKKGMLALAERTYLWWDGLPETAGGQMSTGREMMHFAEMILRDGYYHGRRVIGKKALSFLWTNLLDDFVRDVSYNHNCRISYGAGVPVYSGKLDREQILSEGMIYHEGAGGCVFLLDREEDFAAMFQTSYRKEFDWCHRAAKGTASIIWSGIK